MEPEPDDVESTPDTLSVIEPPPPVEGDQAPTVPPWRPVTEPITPPTRRSLAPVFAVAAVGVVAIGAAVAAYALAPPEVVRTPLSEVVDGNGLSVRAPTGWRSAAPTSAQAIPGLELRDAVALTPSQAPSGDAVLMGWTDTDDPALVPAEAVGDAAPDRVKLGDHEAFRYGPFDASGATVTIYAVPTSNGVATVACRHSAAGDVSRVCDGIADSLELRTGEAFALPPRAQFIRDVDAIMADMRRDEAASGRDLSQAGRAGSQADALRGLADAYGRAAASLKDLAAAPFEASARDELVADLERLQRRTDSLADAAAGGFRKRYAAGRTEVRRLRAAIPEQVEALAAIGPAGAGK